MVSVQLRQRGILDEGVLRAMGEVPRHLFVPENLRRRAYDDGPLPIGSDQTISQPFMVALMTQLLRLRPEDRVLEIGTGSGYQTAILGALAREVVSIERQPALVLKAKEVLAELDVQNVKVLLADGSVGWPEEAPYDAILVTAGGPHVPTPLVDQLAVGGRLVCPVGTREVQKVVCITKTEAGLREEESVACMFVPLVGEEGWSEE